MVCIVTIHTLKTVGTITYRDFNAAEAKKCMLVHGRLGAL